MPKVRPILLVILACGLLSLSFGWPLLTHISATGIWDWSEAAAHYESTRHTILKYNQFPLWNPYMCGGGPSLGNPQTYWLSLTGLLALLFGSIVGPKIAVLLYVFLGSLGLWLLTQQLKMSKLAGLLAPPIFLASGYLATHLAAGQFLWLNLAWVPFIWLGYLKSEKNWRWLFFGAAFLTIIGLEGRSYLVAYLSIMLLSYGLMADLVGTSRRSLLRAGLLLAIAFLLGAWKFIPDIFFLAVAPGGLNNTATVPFSILPSMFLLKDVTPNAPFSNLFMDPPRPWFEYGYYVGVVPLLLAGFGLIVAIRRRRYIPWIFTGIIMSVVALSSGDQNILELIPFLKELRNQQRAMSMVIFIMAILAAVGLERLLQPLRSRKIYFTALALIIVGFVAVDLAGATQPALTEGYAKIARPEGAGEVRLIYPLITQGQGLNDPFPEVYQNRGATGFCPAILNAWYDEREVMHDQMEGYRGEVYLKGDGSLTSFLVTPNQINAQVDTNQSTLLVVNQNNNPGWRTSVGSVVADEPLLTIQVPPGQHDVKLNYRPPGLILGLILFATSISVWLALAYIYFKSRLGE